MRAKLVIRRNISESLRDKMIFSKNMWDKDISFCIIY